MDFHTLQHIHDIRIRHIEYHTLISFSYIDHLPVIPVGFECFKIPDRHLIAVCPGNPLFINEISCSQVKWFMENNRSRILFSLNLQFYGEHIVFRTLIFIINIIKFRCSCKIQVITLSAEMDIFYPLKSSYYGIKLKYHRIICSCAFYCSIYYTVLNPDCSISCYF